MCYPRNNSFNVSILQLAFT
uniref:Uncharacterized protein n=1 Tax=Anguilla anguilla TaxID=7936 RepID=A0A0E9PCG5_ANGAN